MCSYLLHRLYLLNPQDPAYMSVLPSNSPRPESTEDFLHALARRLGAVQKGGFLDLERAERWFIQWWRNGGAVPAPSPYGWGLDFSLMSELGEGAVPPSADEVEKIMGKLVDDYVLSLSEERVGERVSLRQEKRAEREAKVKARMQRRALSRAS
ncbi:Mitochondrial GTPase [Ceratobasidium sp. 414]|nr:Mitochondrial GTPase [Ceratobasidium sp. 414]